MTSLSVVYNVDTPYKHTYIDPVHNQFIESFLTSGQADQFNNHSLDMDACWRDEDFYIQKKGFFIPSHKFDFGNYFDNGCKNEFTLFSDDSKAQDEVDTGVHSNELQSPSKLGQNDMLSVAGSNHYGAEVHDIEVSEKEVKAPRKKSVPKVSKASKKISKKGKGKKKVRKSKRMSERLKNIVKNYGKNCATFAIGELGHQFLLEALSEEEIPRFKEYIRSKIPSITNIANFREMLLVSETEPVEIGVFKKAFQHVCEVFVRDYSFNWIFHSPRINDVKGHIFARFKMLRRIRDPKNFTYIH